MDVVGLYSNIPHDKGLLALRKRLDEREEKDVSTGTLVELAELVLKNNIFNFNEKFLKQKRGTAIWAKFAPPYSFLFMAELEEKNLKKLVINYIYGGDIQMTSFSSGKEQLKNFVGILSEIHPTIKFTAEWS